jgi:hypothetical protein
MNTGTYRIHTPILVLRLENGIHTAHTVPVGTTITVERNGGGTRLLEAVWDGKRAFMFGVDLSACAEKSSTDVVL